MTNHEAFEEGYDAYWTASPARTIPMSPRRKPRSTILGTRVGWQPESTITMKGTGEAGDLV
jgi:hypothetical protein